MIQILTQASLLVLFNMIVALVPLGMAVIYVIRPNEQRLALMRPLSLAAIFSAIANVLLGLVNLLRYAGMQAEPPTFSNNVALGLSETILAGFFAFSCLTVAWLLVAVGMRRQA